jgi:hypothetical protein
MTVYGREGERKIVPESYRAPRATCVRVLSLYTRTATAEGVVLKTLVEDEELRHKQDFDNLRAEGKAEADINALREQEAARHVLRMGEINRQEKEQKEAEDPFQSLKDLIGNFTANSLDVGGSISASIGEMVDTTVSSLGRMKGALEQGIKANILYGDSLGKAIKKAAAEELAGISARATVKGLEHAAYALGSLAFGDFGGAAKHTAASAAFFSLAAATGLTASALAGSTGMKGGSARGQAIGASTGNVAQSERDPTIREGRRGGSPDPNLPTGNVWDGLLRRFELRARYAKPWRRRGTETLTPVAALATGSCRQRDTSWKTDARCLLQQPRPE